MERNGHKTKKIFFNLQSKKPCESQVTFFIKRDTISFLKFSIIFKKIINKSE